jgi:hypothetical protein
VDPAREGVLAGLAEALLQIEAGDVVGLVDRLDLDARVREAARIVGADVRRDARMGRVDVAGSRRCLGHGS